MGIEGSIGDRSEIDIDVSALNVELPESEQSGSLPTDLSEDIVVINKYDRRDSTNQVDDFLSKGATAPGVLRANIDVKIDRDSFVRHPNGYLNFAADIQADILGNRILLSGQVDSVRGEFEFLGRDFNVDRKEGIVRFTGSSPPNPKLDVVAIHPLDRSVVADLESSVRKNPQIFVRVTGSAYEPKLDLTSEPTMSESEIIFVLMTGRPPSKADVGQEEGVASQAAAAAGGIFAALIQQKISKTLPVDVFRFESGEGGLAGSQLRVGKYITSDLFISYAYKFGADEEDSGYEARVEYHFLPQWMVEARYGENQTGELNVFWDIY
jgi:translocation and assembly module TamB